MKGNNMYGIVANVVSDRILRPGARVWILYCNGDAENPFVYDMSKGGRLVQKYIPHKRLACFRSAWIPEHLRDRFRDTWMWEDNQFSLGWAAILDKQWAGVRFYDRDGVLLQDGKTTGQAFGYARSGEK